MALENETKSEVVAKNTTKHKASTAPAKEHDGKKKDAKVKYDGSIPTALRGVIKGQLPKRAARLGGNVTNAEYAKEKGITPRQASKIRSGRKKAA